MHEQSGYRVIAARGDAKGLALSFSRQFKSALRERIPDVAQIVVPDPETVHGKRDLLNVRHPQLYEHGLKGFHRVYDRLGWRVYRKNNV